MDGVDCDWCLVCEKHTAEGETYCSEECRLTDLMSSSASSSSSSSSAGSAYFSSPSDLSLSLATSSSSINDNYPMPPFVRKQRTSIPNVYAQCTSNPNPPASLMFTTGGNGASALSHHLLLQQQQLQLQQQSKQQQLQLQQQSKQQQQQYQNQNDLASGGVHYVSTTHTGANASQYPLFHAALSAFRPASPSGPQQ